MADDPTTIPTSAPARAAPVTGDAETLPEEPSGRPLLAGEGDPLPTISRDHYRIGRELARGGMGRIVTAHDRRLGREIALKEALSGEAADLVRFEREVRLTARLQHPNIVSIYEAGRWPSGEPFYAMRLVAGRPFNAVIAEAKTLDARLALVPHVLAIAEALAYAHAQRVIHRDLKPGNVLIGTYGETVVIDWGLAKDLADVTSDGPPSLTAFTAARDAALTQLGSIMGTPSYMPLEQATGQALDQRADVYAIGAILYHVLSGALPYEGATGLAVVEALVAAPPPPLATREPGVPADLVAIVERAMARDPEQRYASAKALADDLLRYQAGQLVGSHHYTPGEHIRRWVRRHRGAVAVAAVATLLALGGGIASYVQIVGERDAAREAQIKADAATAEATRRADDLTIAHARSAMASDPTAAVVWLRKLAPDSPHRRAAEIIALDAETRGVARLLASSSAGFRALATSGDGKLLLAGDADGVLRVFDLTGGRPRIVGTAPGPIEQISLSADGTQAIVIAGRTVQRWSVPAGTRQTLEVEPGSVPLAAAISPDAAWFAYARSSDRARLCNAASNTCREIMGHALGLQYSPDSRQLLVTTEQWLWRYDVSDPQLRILEKHPCATMRSLGGISGIPWARPGAFAVLASGELLTLGFEGVVSHGTTTEPSLIGGTANRIAASPDGAWWVVAGANQVEAWAPGGEHTFLTEEGSELIAFAPHGALLAVAGADGAVLLFDLSLGSTRVLRGHVGRVHALAFVEDGAALVSAGDDGQLRRWSMSERVSSETIGSRVPMGSAVSASVSGALAFGSTRADGQTAIFAIRADGTRLETSATNASVVKTSDDGRVAWFTTFAATRLWWLDTGETADTELVLHRSSERGVRVTDERLEVHTLRDNALVWSTPVHESVVYAYDPALTRVAIRVSRTRVTISGPGVDHELDPGIEIASRDALRWSADGRWLVVVGEAGEVRACELERWTCRGTATHEGPVTALAIASDGQIVVSAGTDGVVRILTTATGASEVLRRNIEVLDLVLSADSRTLLERDATDTIWIRDFPSGEERVLPPLLEREGDRQGALHLLAAGTVAPIPGPAQQLVAANLAATDIRVLARRGVLARFPRALAPGPSFDAQLAALTNATLDEHGNVVAP